MTRALIAHQLPRTPERFSRVLAQSNPAVRSSAVHIVPMATKQPLHPADRIVAWGCAFGAVAMVIFAGLGWL